MAAAVVLAHLLLVILQPVAVMRHHRPWSVLQAQALAINIHGFLCVFFVGIVCRRRLQLSG